MSGLSAQIPCEPVATGAAVRPARRAAAAVALLALVLGAALRFEGLGRREISNAEACSWAAAVAPTNSELVRLQAILNPGKLPLYEFLLSAWARVFGESEAALRSLSAAFGTLALVLVLWITLECLASDPTDGGAGPRMFEPRAPDAALVSALAALVFAVNVVTIKYSREVRMYSMQLGLIVAQVGFFLRARRRGGFLNYLGTGVLTALALAVHFATASVVVSEGFYLLYLWYRYGSKRIFATGFAVAFGVAMLAPFLPIAVSASAQALRGQVWNWIRPPAPWEPITLFNRATGSFAFPVLFALAVLGVVRGWRRAQGAVEFAMVWMWGPPLIMVIGSWVFRPMAVENYALSSFVPFFILVALGIASIDSAALGAGAAAAVVALSLGHLHSYYRKPHAFQYREAAALALPHLQPGQALAVPSYLDVYAFRYYVAPPRRADVIEMPPGAEAIASSTPPVGVVILSDSNRAKFAWVAALYPRKLGHVRGYSVLSR